MLIQLIDSLLKSMEEHTEQAKDVEKAFHFSVSSQLTYLHRPFISI